MVKLMFIASSLLASSLLSVSVYGTPVINAALERRGGHDARSEANIKPTDQVGEAHGTAFDDISFPQYGHGRIDTISMKGCSNGEHLTYLVNTYSSLSPPFVNKGSNAEHGNYKKAITEIALSLQADEYVVKVELTTYRAKTGKFHSVKCTRIGSIKMTTNK